MNENLYRLVVWGFQELVWGGDLLGADELPNRGPAVFVSNHLGALGPIAVGASVPLRLHAWTHADMLDPLLAADYLRRDFVEGQLHLMHPFSDWLARGISKLHVPLLRAVGCIPVHNTPEGLAETFRLSVDLLAQGECLLIFPENPNLPIDPRYQMTPFKKGFARLGELLYERTKQILSFHPLAVHAQTFTVRVGKPIRYNPLGNSANERVRIKNLLECSIHEMYLQASEAEIVQLPLPN
ncbi:MAG: lysophospholipid acyltransferase family protein [Chloroflexota bacterium]